MKPTPTLRALKTLVTERLMAFVDPIRIAKVSTMLPVLLFNVSDTSHLLQGYRPHGLQSLKYKFLYEDRPDFWPNDLEYSAEAVDKVKPQDRVKLDNLLLSLDQVRIKLST